jgi:hypothetical protein
VTDIVQLLREYDSGKAFVTVIDSITEQAADEIEALRAALIERRVMDSHERPSQMPRPYPPELTEQERRLDRALCCFCNQAGDPFQPASQWDEYVRRDLAELAAAYNEWYKLKVMQK